MNMKTHNQLRDQFKKYFTDSVRNHTYIKESSLIVTYEPSSSTLFTSAGMQQLIPYIKGEKEHPQGKRLCNIQPCLRTGDIDEVGDNRHSTFLEMLGNWSLGDYYKSEQLAWYFEFLTKNLQLPKNQIYISIFKGSGIIEKDIDSERIWKKIGIDSDHIYHYDAYKNWWSRSGIPEYMMIGDIGGPCSEVFFQFNIQHKAKYGLTCHPNCDCGRFMEIGNSVFMQYVKDENGSLIPLVQKCVDFGGGLERTLSAINQQPDIYLIDVNYNTVQTIESEFKLDYKNPNEKLTIRKLSDYIKAATMIISSGILPSNKEHGYVLRKLLRRSAVILAKHGLSLSQENIASMLKSIYDIYFDLDSINMYPINKTNEIITTEITSFSKILQIAYDKLSKNKPTGKILFDLYQSNGLPLDLALEYLKNKKIKISLKEINEFNILVKKHSQLSKTQASGIFKGGLISHQIKTIQYHTATHLLHQALREVLGTMVRQEGSSITPERLRFDFNYSRKPTEKEIQTIQNIINNKISQKLPVTHIILPKKEAEHTKALSFFKEKYPDMVNIYYIGGDNISNAYSVEYCGGPHVKNTKEINPIKVTQVKKIGANIIRLYAS